MSTILISLLCTIDAIEQIRAAVCAAAEYERELAQDMPARDQNARAAIAL